MKVKAELLSTITISASLDSQISADADIGKMIPVVAQVNGNLAEQAHFFDNILNVGAEIVNEIMTDAPDVYDGDYEVTSFLAAPSLTSSLILPTRDKLMRDNVTVYSVPTMEEYNPQGGVTFTIGG